MRYYKNVINGKTVGIAMSPNKLTIVGFFEVDKDEFEKLEETFGKVEPVEEKDLTKDQIQALSDRQEFLEDCIAEMALTVYQE